LKRTVADEDEGFDRPCLGEPPAGEELHAARVLDEFLLVLVIANIDAIVNFAGAGAAAAAALRHDRSPNKLLVPLRQEEGEEEDRRCMIEGIVQKEEKLDVNICSRAGGLEMAV
jgi:hypothetical protein